MANKSVVHLTNAIAPDKLGGLERYVRELAERLAQDGFSVAIIAKQVLPSSPLREKTPSGISILRHPVPSKQKKTFAVRYPFAVGRGVLRDLREMPRGSTLNCHYVFTTLPLLLTRRKYIYTFHAPVHKEILMERGSSYLLPKAVQRVAVFSVRCVEMLVLRRAKKIVVLSDAMAQEVKSLSPKSFSKIVQIPGGFDNSFFAPPPGNRIPHSQSGLRLFTARRLTTRTGVVELVTAIAELRSRGLDVNLRIAGDGHQRQDVEERAHSLGISESVSLLGRISDEEVRDEYWSADLVVMPTQHLEGFGLTSAEALACGAIVVATPVGANREVIGQFNPRLVTVDATPTAIANLIQDIAGDQELLNELRERAPLYAAQRWSWQAVAKAYEGVYGQ